MPVPASIDTLKASINRRGGVAKANRFAIYVSHPSKKGGLLGGLINTDYANYANRIWIVGSGDQAETYDSCSIDTVD